MGNIARWTPPGNQHSSEFQFLLNLINEEDDRAMVMKFVKYSDMKLNLVSRLLIRRASALVLGHTNFRGLRMARTKGKKPFLAGPLTTASEAPNWNMNVSHDGDWVVLASEPLCVVGVDVSEPVRRQANGEVIEFYNVFKDNLSDAEWRVVRNSGPTIESQFMGFSRFWTAKEAFTKARGDGLAFPFANTEFEWSPNGVPDNYVGNIKVSGKHAPRWRFFQQRLPDTGAPWVTVARGPMTDIVDAYGQFTATFRRKQESFEEEEWNEILGADEPPFEVMPMSALVPYDDIEAYVQAGGTR